MNKLFNTKLGIIFCIVILFILTLLSSRYFSSANVYLSKNRNGEIVTRLIDEVWSKGNLEVADELVAPQYTIRHDPGDKCEGKTLDLATYKERVKMSLHVFPDQKFEIVDLVCDGNKVAVSWRFTGTQKGAIPGLPNTNKTIHFSGITIYYLANGKVIGHWQVVDRLGLMSQLTAGSKSHKI
jgi:predicted ester cyclase